MFPSTRKAFAPGCALMLYKPDLARKVHQYLVKEIGDMPFHNVCCKNEPGLTELTEIINICPGCDKRFRTLYPASTTISLWEIIDSDRYFPFPDYGGRRMTIQDACPTRDQERIHRAIRSLLKKMNIIITEPLKTGSRSVCCGDSFYGQLSDEQLNAQMEKRASEMPEEEVAVYCISCVNSMIIGGKKPRYLVDLLFGEETSPSVVNPRSWHDLLDIHIAQAVAAGS